MKKIFVSMLRMPVMILLAIGIGFTIMALPDTIVSFKEPVDFEEMMDTEIENGDHIKGDIMLSLGLFATEDTVKTSKNGTTISASKDTAGFYVVPGVENVYVGIRIKKENISIMDKITDETLSWISGKSEGINSELEFEGRVVKMDDELAGLFEDWLLDFGYTQAEIDDMDDFLLIEARAFSMLRIMSVIGIVCILAAIVMIVIGYRKLSKQEMHLRGGYADADFYEDGVDG